jgi:hypothetical protein
MRFGDEFKSLHKAYRPTPDIIIIGRGRRFRDPDEQAEVESRVAFYAKLVEKRGRITPRWLPWRGNGQLS